MKKTQLKDALRNIWKQKVSFLSIVVIALLGVTTFLGIGYSADALRKNASAAYNQQNFRDLEVISTRLLTPEDLDCMRAIEGVADIEPVWQTAGNAYIGEEHAVVTVISLTERINRLNVTEGRLPQDGTECAIERKIADETGWKIGDQIEWIEMTDLTGMFYDGGAALTITGIAEHPDHVSLAVPETPYLFVRTELFNLDEMDGCCMKAEITVQKAANINRFTTHYDRTVANFTAEIETLSEERIPLRDEQVRTLYFRQLDEAEAALEQLTHELTSDGEPAISEESYAAAVEALNEQRKTIEELQPGKWFVLDGHGSPSFVQLIIGSGNLKSLEMTFSLLFVLVGALVIYATVSKMIDEQRTLVGTTKALGFFNREIFAKYLLFGLTAAVLGAVLGVILARFALEPFVLKGYNAYYTYDTSASTVTVVPTLIVVLAAALLAVAAITFACIRLLRTPAVQLMQQQVPAGKKTSARSEKQHLTLYSRLILRNIRTDLKRVLVTVASVAGCCALVVIGFTLKAAVDGAIKNQYTSVVNYDAKTECEFSDEMEDFLKEAGVEYIPLFDRNITYRVTDIQVGELFCGDIAEIQSMYRLNDWKTGQPIAPTDDGVLIQRRLAEIYHLDVGSEIGITVGGTNAAMVPVAGIYENYIGRVMVMSDAAYEARFGSAPTKNAFLLRLNGADETELKTKIKNVIGFISYTPSDADKELFRSATAVVNAIVVLFIVMAAIMAGVVLTNLTNIYIMQKKRELTIMRINGFTVKEVIGYCTRETVLTTIAGVVLGLALGSGIAYRIVRSMEQSFLRFDRGISLFAWLIGAALTIVFTVIINAVVLRKVKKLKLNDVAS